ncbi:ABC transporter ATP-binding protein [Nocardioides bizhenqiangii]|uniref:ABC transporter ATP-binding protein n=1 Tax=Nocardioides bizhenqiangii TaxID=3095076 RepID=A0ABZ0ZUI4_9ACTN|nr:MULTISPECIES: ABC transporter ATP-binding protein [unclassified Nocardioides]MDZ5621755.1 ABC transporter ATP-binding protein [Nocardioides sp. HM23]WQQ27559.1 ABC transporter ATP-binding protein [Nocardioides sp. HM61]
MATAYRQHSTGLSGGAVDAEPSIVVRDLGKTFDNGVRAISSATLHVASGEFVSIVGESGCGKSTLLRIVAGLTPPSDGSVEVSGTRVVGPRRDVGLMFQRPALLDWKTALENALLPVGIHRRVTRADVSEAMGLLELFGLKGSEFRFPRQLSGGMQQRVALARLLMTGAQVRLLDEPFGAVDELTREHLNVELLRIHDLDVSATLLVTHNITEAVLLSDRVIVMGPRPGRVVGDIAVNLPRPRSAETTQSQEFQRLVGAVRARLVEDSNGGAA